MTKAQIIDEINNNLNSIENAVQQDLMSNNRYGIDEKYEVGEYAFFESDNQDDYDFFIDDMKSEIKEVTGYDGDLNFCTWSSKSGTSVFIDAFDYNSVDSIWDFESEWGFSHNNTEVGEFTYVELMDIFKDSKVLKNEICEARKLYDEKVEEITKIVDSMSEGKRSGCFSNGEVIFTPTDPEKETFTAYYNPNEECA